MGFDLKKKPVCPISEGRWKRRCFEAGDYSCKSVSVIHRYDYFKIG